MIKFSIKLACLTLLLIAVVTGVFAFRLIDGQRAVVSAHTITNGIDYVFIGSSRMGCSIAEAPEFKNRVIWRSGQSHHFVLMRLLEMERQGQLKKAKCCFVEMGSPCLGSYETETMVNSVVDALPLTWRYFQHETCVGLMSVAIKLFLNPKQEFGVVESQPDDKIPFSQRTAAEQARNVSDCHFGHFGWLGDSDENWKVATQTADQLLDRIKCICDRNGVKLFYIKTPVTDLYAAKMPECAKKFDQHISLVVAEKNIGVAVVPSRMDDDFFRDSHHLSKEGAREFTKYLYENNDSLELK